jgi:23S rRNA (pseudouridine1915-N3)-methyltransferase
VPVSGQAQKSRPDTVLIRVAAIGQRMPNWVADAWQEYARRFPSMLRLELTEISMQRRGKNADIARLKVQEGTALMNAVPRGARSVALDIGGQAWSTQQLASRMEDWMAGGSDVCLLVGGPDGLSADCLSSVDSRWSLGPLTLPHPLVRVVLAEQLYRAWTIINQHPYHRQ